MVGGRSLKSPRWPHTWEGLRRHQVSAVSAGAGVTAAGMPKTGRSRAGARGGFLGVTVAPRDPQIAAPRGTGGTPGRRWWADAA
jgi:hypothetical protein